jgi:hypothetical protein
LAVHASYTAMHLAGWVTATPFRSQPRYWPKYRVPFYARKTQIAMQRPCLYSERLLLKYRTGSRALHGLRCPFLASHWPLCQSTVECLTLAYVLFWYPCLIGSAGAPSCTFASPLRSGDTSFVVLVLSGTTDTVLQVAQIAILYFASIFFEMTEPPFGQLKYK